MKYQFLRKKFIEFFSLSPRLHKQIPSSSLIPENDPTVLFITAGMHPLVPYLMGEIHPLGKRLVDIQKCMRTDDIEEVGDTRHFTFFEMLGNWSLGDYFKTEAIEWSFEFLTHSQWLNIDPTRLYVSVFSGDKDAPRDEESIRVWKHVFASHNIHTGVGNPDKNVDDDMNRIFPYPKTKNWWGPAGHTGPCGPDTEIFYDTKLPQHNKKIHGPICHINCDCGRYVEIWNNVFMQFHKKDDGTYEPLKQKNVDTGMGMERMIALLSWLNKKITAPDPFQTELFEPILAEIINLSHTSYEEPYDRSIRIIADHLRASVFLLADGVIPSNKERGYVLRRLIRRALRHANRLGIHIQCVRQIAQKVISVYAKYYNNLITKQSVILAELEMEESKFLTVLKSGLKEIEKQKIISGKTAFDVYQSFGFPLELTIEIAKERGQFVNRDQFEEEFEKHKNLSRSATKGVFKGGLQDHSEATTKLHTATHLLQQSLRIVLGNHVRQKGSHITASRLRFDFSHPNKLTEEEIRAAEIHVNNAIKENLPISMVIMDYKQALEEQALTVPDTAYPEKVKVYTIGLFSKEVCGGPHVNFTGVLGSFKIVKEEALSRDVRRIYAILT